MRLQSLGAESDDSSDELSNSCWCVRCCNCCCGPLFAFKIVARGAPTTDAFDEYESSRGTYENPRIDDRGQMHPSAVV